MMQLQSGNGSSGIARGKAVITHAIKVGKDPKTAIARALNRAEDKGTVERQRGQMMLGAAQSYRQRTGKGIGGVRDFRKGQRELREDRGAQATRKNFEMGDRGESSVKRS